MKETPQLEVHSPGGWSGLIRGVDLRDFLVILIILGGLAFVWWSENERSKVYLEAHKFTQKLLGEVVATLGQVITNQALIVGEIKKAREEAAAASAVQTYVMTLSQAERERLRLNMPPSLRRELLEQRR